MIITCKNTTIDDRMKNDIKSLFLNIIAGILAYYVTKYLDKNDLPLLSYLVFALYLAFILLASYFHFQNSLKPNRDTLKKDTEKSPDQNKENHKPEIFHKILQCVVKLASQHAQPSPKKIGEIIGESPQIVLAYLKEMETDSLVVFVNGGKPADINTPFHVAYHDNPWKYINITSGNQALNIDSGNSSAAS